MKNTIFLLLSLILPAATTFSQQPVPETSSQTTPPVTAGPAIPNGSQAPAQFASNTLIPAELSKSVDAKKVKVGDQIEAKSTVDMLSNGQIVMPRNTRVMGHVTSVKAHSKESPDSMVGISFDRLIMKDGREMPLQALLQAVGPPLNAFSAGGGAPVAPVGPGSGGGAPGGMGAGSMGGGGRGGASSQPSYPSAGMPSSPDSSVPHGSSTGALSPSSQGVVGIRDLSLSATPQASVLSSSSKNVHLDGGTQLMLRVE
jgi:hypothetical protein